MIRVLAALALSAQAAGAGPVTQVDPAELMARLAGVMDFDNLPVRPEPGLAHDLPLTAPGLALGERFVGQNVSGHPHDALTGAPTAPLTLAQATPGQHLSTAFHPGFGSNALFPVGPDGFPALSARGEGAVALLLETDVAALTLLIHADYADPFGARPAPGRLTVTFFDRTGAVLDRHRIDLTDRVIGLGFLALEGGVAGVTLESDDPGGLAIDEIRYPLGGLHG